MENEVTDELVALDSIYGAPEFVYTENHSSNSHMATGRILVHMELPSGGVNIRTLSSLNSTTTVSNEIYVQHLPAVILHFSLPKNYPSETGPSVVVAADWLPIDALHSLRTQITEIIAENIGSPQLFILAQYIQHDALNSLELLSTELSPSSSASSSSLSHSLPSNILFLDHQKYPKSIDYFLAAADQHDAEIFVHSTITCAICQEPKIGANCFRFNPCLHAYCLSCLNDYFTIHIKEGNVSQVTCPHEGCKRRRGGGSNGDGNHNNNNKVVLAAPPLPLSTVTKILLSSDSASNSEAFLVVRYGYLLEQYALLQQPNLTYCPRKSCNAPTLKDAEEEKLCVCPKCTYAFCYFCNRSWHGYAAYCQIRHLETIASEYVAAGGDSDKRRIMELRYGKKVLEKVVREIEEDALNRGWFKDNAQSCPNCTCLVERSEGCCHMTCKVCDTHFCFVCGERLNPANPYLHFNTKGTSCYGKLFEGSNAENYDPLADPLLMNI